MSIWHTGNVFIEDIVFLDDIVEKLSTELIQDEHLPLGWCEYSEQGSKLEHG